jgi:arabinose-5-phosphate isomerase
MGGSCFMNKLAEGKRVFDIEIEALKKTRDSLDDTFVQILDLITDCKGKVIITGMGKPGHIATKLAATFASLGTPSFCLHPAEAMHGDLGMISENDLVIAISYSGESDEIVKIIPNIKMIGATLVGITGNANSTLAQTSDVVQVLPKFEEACYLGLAPTSSTTSVLCYGDALAVVASGIYGFKDADFGKFHPAGSLGKKLILKVDDLMAKGGNNAKCHVNVTLKDAIVELSKKGLGVVSIIDDNDNLLGVITDGDLRRQLERGADIYSLCVEEVMTKTPTTIQSGKLAVEALNMLKKKNISCMPVVENDRVIGTIRLQDIIGVGIVG